MKRNKHLKASSYKGKKIDVLVLVGLLALGSLYAYFTKGMFIGKPIITGGVFTLLPAFYLAIRKRKNWSKILVSTLLFGVLFGFICDFFSEYTKAWDTVSLVIPYRIFGVSPVDNILGFVFMTFLTVIFYEHFIEHEKSKHVSKNIVYALLPGIFVTLILLLIYFVQPTLLQISYPYFLMGVVAVLPIIFLSFKKPKLIKNMLETAVYFFFLYFIIEIFAISDGFWVYPGNSYIGWVSILGLRFPFEELFFWMMFYAASLVSYYELFID